MSVNLDDYGWLTSVEGQSWLEFGRSFAGDPLALVTKLRTALTPEQAHLIAEQIELRHRAQRKFSAADRMLFTRIGLEQATSDAIASYKARRFAAFERTADLCCGLGGDLFGLASRTVAAGYDRSQISAKLCQYNLAAFDHDATVVCQEACRRHVAQVEAWHIDPDRRASGRRTIDPSDYAPSLRQIEELITCNPHAAIKLAPATTFISQIDLPCERQWIGHGRECPQQVAWFGDLVAEPGLHTATVLAEEGAEVGYVAGTGTERAGLSQLERYLIEPHSAIIAAGLVGAFASQANMHLIDPRVVYLTADQPVHAAGAGCFEVVMAIPFDEKSVRAELKSRNLISTEIKKRCVQTEPQQLARRLGRTGEIPCALILTPMAGQIFALIAQRVVKAETDESS